MNEALGAIAKVLHAVEMHYADSETYFGGVSNIGGAVSLLYVVDDGLRERAKRQLRRTNGDFSEDDYPRDV